MFQNYLILIPRLNYYRNENEQAYLQPYLQPYVYIACTALNQAFQISVLKLEFALLDNIGFQLACSRVAKWQPQHTVVLVFVALG